MVFFTIIICILAGLGAGISTGFAGLSAACFITPILVAVLKVPIYDAVGIALASDILASAVSAYTYGKEGNIDLKHSRIFMILILVFAILGSIIAHFLSSFALGDTVLGYWSIGGSLFVGVMFWLRPGKGKEKPNKLAKYASYRKLLTILLGAYIGFICGFQGTGGGMMMLFTLTIVMQFAFKPAVGTSVFIMTFTALIGAISHFTINGMPDTLQLVICILSTTIFARIGAIIANKIEAWKLKQITGILLTISGVLMLALKIFWN